MILGDLNNLLFKFGADVAFCPDLGFKVFNFELQVVNLRVFDFAHLALLLYDQILLFQ